MHEVQLRAGESTNLSVSPSSTLNNSLFLSSACIPPLRPFFLLFHHNKNPQFFIVTPSSFFTFSSISLIYYIAKSNVKNKKNRFVFNTVAKMAIAVPPNCVFLWPHM